MEPCLVDITSLLLTEGWERVTLFWSTLCKNGRLKAIQIIYLLVLLD